MGGGDLMDVEIYPAPNKGIAAFLIASPMRSAMLMFARRLATLYEVRVARQSNELAESTVASAVIHETRWGPRWAGKVTVDSEHFIPHEEGWTDEDGVKHVGAHDFNALLNGMAGLQ